VDSVTVPKILSRLVYLTWRLLMRKNLILSGPISYNGLRVGYSFLVFINYLEVGAAATLADLEVERSSVEFFRLTEVQGFCNVYFD